MARDDIELACDRASAGQIVLVRERVAATDLELVELGADVELALLEDAPQAVLEALARSGLEVPTAPARFVVALDSAGVVQWGAIMGPGARRVLA
jgi:hypothetical protein